MSVDLSQFTQNYLYAISPPGQALQGTSGPYVNMTETEIVGRLVDAFWSWRMAGMDFLAGYSCTSDGIISPRTDYAGNGSYTGQYLPEAWWTDGSTDLLTGLPDLGRQIVQAIIIWAAYKSVQTQLLNLKTATRYSVSGVSAETQQAATVLQGILKTLTAEIDIVLSRLSDVGMTTVTVFDAVMNVTRNEGLGDSWWVRGGGYDFGGRDRV